MQIVSNADEYSCTISRPEQNLDFAVLRQERQLTIGLTNNNKDVYREIVLSPDEARQLREHLNDPETLRILGICDISSVRCPDCKRMVSDFQRHSCAQ